MNIAVVGTGYVGLVVGTCFAESGNQVVCVDTDAEKVRLLQQGTLPIYEPGLKDFLERNVQDKRLQFTTDLKKAVETSQIIFISVGTPSQEGGEADLRFVSGVARDVARLMNEAKIIVIKSTVPCGTAAEVEKIISQNTSHAFDVVVNPEFLKEGVAVEDFMKPDRVVLGLERNELKAIFIRLYEPFVRTGKPLVFMDRLSAEMTKYASNGMLALRLSYMNEVANLCDALGADVEQVRRGIGADSRIGRSFLFPGVGYGGSCFPKDVDALVHIAEKAGSSFQTLKATAEVNRKQQHILAEKIKKYFSSRGGLSGKKIGVWGLAFKPRTDDMREAPSLTIIGDLLQAGAKVSAFDPVAMPAAQKIFKDLRLNVELCANAYDAMAGADGLALVTEWNEFRRPDFKKLKEVMRHAAVFDGRNIFDPLELQEMGFAYQGVGRRQK